MEADPGGDIFYVGAGDRSAGEGAVEGKWSRGETEPFSVFLVHGASP